VPPSQDVIDRVIKANEEVIGKIARPKHVYIVPDMPKTRSGKIMRRVLAAISNRRADGDVTTLANPDGVEQIRAMVQGKDTITTQEALPEDIAKFGQAEYATLAKRLRPHEATAYFCRGVGPGPFGRCYSSTCAPTSNTWFAGILKKAVARALRDMKANRFSRHWAMPCRSEVTRVSRPRKNVVPSIRMSRALTRQAASTSPMSGSSMNP